MPAAKKTVKATKATGAIKLSEGKTAPAFSLPATSGGKVSLKDFKGKKAVVLYFYPKDNTPGCTLESCEFGAAHKKFVSAKAEILGVSPDGLKSHDKFIAKFKLPFTLLADEDHQIADKYGAWGEKMLYGKKYMGILRATFLIDKNGKLAKIWPKVKPEGHAAEVLAAIKNL